MHGEYAVSSLDPIDWVWESVNMNIQTRRQGGRKKSEKR